jgi:hypothetical protein
MNNYKINIRFKATISSDKFKKNKNKVKRNPFSSNKMILKYNKNKI